jgi:hypothetical protein
VIPYGTGAGLPNREDALKQVPKDHEYFDYPGEKPGGIGTIFTRPKQKPAELKDLIS